MTRLKTALHTYRTPILAAVLLLVGLGLWTWQRWTSFQEFGRERMRRHVEGMFQSLEGTLLSLGDRGRFDKEAAELIMEGIVRNSLLRFAVITDESGIVAQAGDVPRELPVSGRNGELTQGSDFLFWRTVRLPQARERAGLGEPPGAAAEMLNVATEPREQVLVMGVGAPPKPPGLSGPVRVLLVTSVAGLLCISALCLAWVLTIRNRIMAAALDSERARRAYLEELSLAAAGLAHETKNPLGIILGLAQRIGKHPGEPKEGRAAAEHIIDEVDRATARLGSFMLYARLREPEVMEVNVCPTLEKVTEVLRPDFDAATVTLELHCSPEVVLADAEMLRQILVNLLLNSLQASDTDSLVTVRFERKGESASLSVQDRGCGISKELLPDIFKPYVSGAANGHGLGLAIVKRYADQQGWSIDVDSEPGRGTTVAISGISLAQGTETRG